MCADLVNTRKNALQLLDDLFRRCACRYIARAAGTPNAGTQWKWSCGFYPGSNPGGPAQRHRRHVRSSARRVRGGLARPFAQAIRSRLPGLARSPGMGSRKKPHASIAASRCRRIGGLLNCDRHRDSWMAQAVRLPHRNKAGRAPAIPVAKTACAAAGAAV